MERTARNAYSSECYRQLIRSADNISCRYNKNPSGGQRVNMDSISMALKESDPDSANQTYLPMQDSELVESRLLKCKRLICLVGRKSFWQSIRLQAEDKKYRDKYPTCISRLHTKARPKLNHQPSFYGINTPQNHRSIHLNNRKFPSIKILKVESPSHCCDTKIITIVFSDRSMRHGSLTMTSIHTFRAPPRGKRYIYVSTATSSPSNSPTTINLLLQPPKPSPNPKHKSQCLTPRLPVALVSPTRKPRDKLRVRLLLPSLRSSHRKLTFKTVHGEKKAPGEAPVASDSGVTNVGIDNGSNQPGEKGIGGVPVSTETTTNANMK